MPSRNVTAVEVTRETMDCLTGRGDPQQRFRIYRLCLCSECHGAGKTMKRPHAGMAPVGPNRCPECRGEGRTLQLVATSGNAEGIGTAIFQLAHEGELEECPIGILEDGGGWLVSPWLPSPRNVSDAGRTLADIRWKKGERNG